MVKIETKSDHLPIEKQSYVNESQGALLKDVVTKHYLFSALI